MSPIDLAIIVLYILGVTLFGSLIGSRSEGLKGYFLGGSRVPAWAVMISIVATETSTATFLSVPSLSYRDGGDFTYLQLAIGYIIGRVLVAVVLLPSYFKGQMYTAYQVLDARFGGATKTAASLLFLLSRTLGDGLRLFLAALVLRRLLLLSGLVGDGDGAIMPIEWAMPASIVLMGVSTIVYTFLGGMTAVVWTDVTQFLIYMIGAVAALLIMVGRLDGGWETLWASGEAAGKFRFLNPSFDLTQPYTIWAGVIGGMVLSTATHGADQMMVQRYLSAKSQRQAAGALIASGFVVFAQFALFLLIGVALSVFYGEYPPDRPLQVDDEFASFIVTHLPTGLVGLVVAAIFSAAMSTLSSSLNASASSTVNDLIRPAFPRIGEEKLLGLSRSLTIVWGIAQMGIAAVAAAKFQDSPVVEDALAIASFVTGIILGVFLLGVLTDRVGQGAALVGLVAGLLAVSYARFGSEFRGTIPYPFEGALAWPYFALVGSGTTFLVGLLASTFLPRGGTPSTGDAR
ncbi:sodium:solute symporter [Tautonia plasticadhaerens]|uniref:Sodium/glucose cotransporter n=1 Tax=Tautonia plasticadhaerens TaxID=2527974 RepID=A0A518H3K9_9BACT|nr:sodium:solute symporter [Tautonia plasticadhaerens]QDV35445.1 Sodium/glucose cotransporter [Tautonia plasticadhaerens]